MTTYLSLCQQVVRRVGIGGATSDKPDSVTGNPHRVQLACDYVAEAVREIESAHLDWTFLRPSVDFIVEAGWDHLDPSETQPDVLSINENSVYGRTEVYHQRLYPLSWQDYRRYRDGHVLTQDAVTLPTYFSPSNDGSIYFYPKSAMAFTLRAECVVRPTVLAANTDEPKIPDVYQDVIVHRAVMMYHEGDEALDLRQATEARYMEWMRRLEGACLPNNAFSLTHSPEEMLVVQAY